MAESLVTVFGGSGFLGRYVVGRLAAGGAVVRAAVRDPEAALFLKSMGRVGQVSLVQANLRDPASVEAAVAGASAVVNLGRHPRRARQAAVRGAAHPCGGAGREGSGRRGGRAVRARVGDRGGPSVAIRVRPHQGRRRGVRKEGVSKRHHPAPKRCVRTGGRVLQPLRCPRADESGSAVDRRLRSPAAMPAARRTSLADPKS